MKEKEIIENIEKALSSLFSKDAWLLRRDLSEQSISHKLAEYLQPVFSEYNVDCEYNGDIDNHNGRKKIIMVKEHLRTKGLLKAVEESDLERQLIERAAFPDIIIHRRGTNEFNLCIIEMKKTTSSVPYDYDFFKLEAYTTDLIGNHLKYQLGVFVLIKIDMDNPDHEMIFYKDGERL